MQAGLKSIYLSNKICDEYHMHMNLDVAGDAGMILIKFVQLWWILQTDFHDLAHDLNKSL